MPRRWLGRTYPTDVQSSIMNMSQVLDGLMAGSVEFTEKTDLDVSDQVRDLNARLVNEVIIESDRLTDEEARARLGEIWKPIWNLQVEFRKNQIAANYPEVASSGNLAVIPRYQAEDLLQSLQKAQKIYVEAVNRYVEARPAAEAALAMPVSGNIAAGMLQDVDRKMDAADQYTVRAGDALEELELLLVEQGDAVQIDRATFNLMRAWTSRVQELDQAISRLEGLTGRQPIDSPILKAARKIPWWVMALVAAGAITGIMILRTTKKA